MYRAINGILKNRELTIVIFKLLIICVVSGCVTPRPQRKMHKAIKPELAVQQEANVLSFVAKEPYRLLVLKKSQTAGWSAGAGSILFSLIDLSIAAAEKSAYAKEYKNEQALSEKYLNKIDEHSKDIDVQKLYWNVLESNLSSSSWLDISEFIKKQPEATITGKPDKNNLVLRTQHYFSNDLTVLIVQTSAYYYPAGKSLAAYFGELIYFSDPIEKSGEAALTEWISDNAAKYRNELNQGITENIRMLNIDFLNFNNQNEIGEQTKITFHSPDSNKKITFEGKILAERGDRVILREKGGNLFSLSTKMK